MKATISSAPWMNSNGKQFAIPFAVGVLAAFVMLGIYLGILSAFQSFGHALQQATQDWVWIGLVAHVEGGLNELDGVTKAVVNLALSSASVFPV